MIRDICKDETFLAQKAEPATPEDLPAAADLLETLTHHSAGCVGMAANMIGVNKRIIAFDILTIRRKAKTKNSGSLCQTIAN